MPRWNRDGAGEMSVFDAIQIMINICVFGMFCGLLLKYGEACNFVEAFQFEHLQTRSPVLLVA